MALGLVFAVGCSTEEPPKKTSGSILKAWPDEPAAKTPLNPDLKPLDGTRAEGVPSDLKPLPAEPSTDALGLRPLGGEPVQGPPPDMKEFPAAKPSVDVKIVPADEP